MARHQPNPIVVEVLYSPSKWVCWRLREPQQGGYFARVRSLPDEGNGRTIPEAVRELARLVADLVADWDESAEDVEHFPPWSDRDQLGERVALPLVDCARPRVLDGTLTSALLDAAGEALLDPADEARIVDELMR